jgi:hypothetical protein
LRARVVAAVGVLIAGAVLAAGVQARPTPSATAAVTRSGAITAPPSAPPTPSQLSTQIAALADSTALQWTAHELGSGALEDPVLGPQAGNYGVAMTGQAVVVAGLASSNESLIDDGLESLLSEVRHPNGGGFELLGLSAAYSFDQAHLAGNPSWLAVRGRIARFLRRHQPTVADLGLCYTSAHCYSNLKLVAPVADLALLQTGLRGVGAKALLRDPTPLRRHSLALIHLAVENTGTDAYRVGQDAFAGAGILSDPSENPLAYHALSTMMLGKAILMLGAQAPADLRQAFARAARALVGLMAPDGDDTYIGRGQAQVWSVAATIDALAIATELTSDSAWRGRYLNAAALAFARLQALYPSRGWGFPLVPRFAGIAAPSSYRGIDHYANTVEYNGLALWELQDAALQLAGSKTADVEPLPADADGAFVDPSHARFAAVTRGGLWYAIHALDSNPGDARYGFGLVAAELDTVDGWEPALPQRPLTSQRTFGGLAMIVGHRILYPDGRQLSVSASGRVTIAGAWRDGSKTVDRGTLWTYEPAPSDDALTLSFVARSGAAYAIQVWYEAGARLLRSRHGLSVAEPDGSAQTYSSSSAVRFSPGLGGGSAYFGKLSSTVMTIAPAAAPRTINFTTLLAAPAPNLGSTGSSGSSAASKSSLDSARLPRS